MVSSLYDILDNICTIVYTMEKKRKNGRVCSRCGKGADSRKLFVIDGSPVCAECIYGKAEPFLVYPIGVVRNNLRRREKRFGTEGQRGLSRIELIPSQKPFMYKLEEEKFLTVVYYLHETESVKSVFRRGLDGKEVGVFASRTPYRLSRLAIQDVKLVKVEGTTLYVEGLDAVNNSPVLDIKMKWGALG